MKLKIAFPAIALNIAICLISSARSEEWNRFRGPNGAGVSDATTVPSEWTKDYVAYVENRPQLTAFIQEKLDNFDQYADKLEEQRNILIKDYLNSSVMIDNILQ